jgi:hypothetical protein
MKNEACAARPGFTLHWIEEVHGLKTDIVLSDSIFDVPADVKIKPLDGSWSLIHELHKP